MADIGNEKESTPSEMSEDMETSQDDYFWLEEPLTDSEMLERTISFDEDIVTIIQLQGKLSAAEAEKSHLQDEEEFVKRRSERQIQQLQREFDKTRSQIEVDLHRTMEENLRFHGKVRTLEEQLCEREASSRACHDALQRMRKALLEAEADQRKTSHALQEARQNLVDKHRLNARINTQNIALHKELHMSNFVNVVLKQQLQRVQKSKVSHVLRPRHYYLSKSVFVPDVLPNSDVLPNGAATNSDLRVTRTNAIVATDATDTNDATDATNVAAFDVFARDVALDVENSVTQGHCRTSVGVGSPPITTVILDRSNAMRVNGAKEDIPV